jgi:hypothetical protein
LPLASAENNPCRRLTSTYNGGEVLIMFCPKCGKEVDDSVKFCPYCGTLVHPDDEKEHIKPEVVTGSDSGNEGEEIHADTAAPAAGNVQHTPAWTLGLLSIIFGAVSLGEVGLILGIIGLCKAKNSTERTMNIVGIVISVALGWIHYMGIWVK